MNLFGPKKDDVWRQISQEIGGEFVDRGFWKGSQVRVQSGPWTLTLDTYTESSGESGHTNTRMRAPYVNPEGFRFTITREGTFSGIGRLLGMQDIEIGDPEFDAAFVIKSNDEAKVRELLDDAALRDLIRAQPRIRLTVQDSEGWFGPSFPDDVDELHFQVPGVLKDPEQIRGLFNLFAATLERLCRIGSAYKQEPGVTL